MVAKSGTGNLQWNAGWFGAQVGSSCWLLFAGIGLASQSPNLSLLLIICFMIPNIVGTLLWMNRSHVSPGKAYQFLLFVLLISTAAAFVIADYLGMLATLDQSYQNPRDMYWILLLFPLLMALLFCLDKKKPG
ncbi:hypothetical protein HBA54_01475 [Pelagibius litoralis]|uniref:Uncharacterized protein n=1 Tax=Pelagibius litoralis TaxID=374515 RepID=A0A967C642_9PROT|nr:hypothetical protein [Pelagibius litoralis]NIA67257.1 hypothetical protein [Pelagibius litoralis]